MTSTIPTVLQRQGFFTEAIGTRVPLIYDPATTQPGGSSGTATRSQFPGNAIPLDRIDPVALTLLNRYPLPTSAGTANNYRRVGDETVNQDQLSGRIDHRLPSNRDQLFARLTRFHETFVPVTPLPEGSGLTSGTLGPQDTTSWAFASSYQRTFSSAIVNEVRVGDTRRHVDREAANLGGTPSEVLGLPGIPSNAQFPTTIPTFLVSGYQQLGSPTNTASDFGTSVTEIADTLSWVKGKHTIKFGGDLRWERLDVIQPPSPTGQFTFSNLFTNLPTDATTAANTGTPLASFLLGQVQQFSIDLQDKQVRNRAHFQEYFVQHQGVYAKLEQRFSGGLSYLVSYTRSKLVDDASSVFDASVLTGPVANFPVADSWNRHLERDYSTGDIPHVFVASAIWDVPFGNGRRRRASGLVGAVANDWTLTGVVTLQSGMPVAIAQTTNTNAFAGFGTQRPNLVGDPDLPANEKSVSRWFNTTAFVPAQQFAIGTSSRNPVHGPAYRNLDLAVMRRVPLATNKALELRAEIFNLTNTPPLGVPNTTAGAAAFGTITSAGDPRVVQLAVKVIF